MKKTRAFLLHLAISCTVVGIVLAVVFFVWYPRPYFQIVGAWSVIRVLILVDLVVGPILTLILYKAGKPRLAFDMTCIAIIQIAALVYGTTTIYAERPLYMIFNKDRYVILSDSDIDATQVAPTLEASRPLIGPLHAIARMPADINIQQELLFEMISGKPDIEFRPEHWYPIESGSEEILGRLKSLAIIAAQDERSAQLVRRFLRSHGGEMADYGFLPVMSKSEHDYSLILNRASLNVIDTIDVSPWTMDYDKLDN